MRRSCDQAVTLPAADRLSQRSNARVVASPTHRGRLPLCRSSAATPLSEQWRPLASPCGEGPSIARWLDRTISSRALFSKPEGIVWPEQQKLAEARVSGQQYPETVQSGDTGR